MHENPDEYGLSSDSLRGSHHYIAPHLVDAEDSRDPMTGRPNPRAKLSENERLALRNVGMLVDENGYEIEPEPVGQVAPMPTVQPRVRPQDRAPAGETKPTPHRQISVDDERTWQSENLDSVPSATIPPYGGTTVDAASQGAYERIRQDRERAESPILPHVNPPTESD